MKIIIFTSKFLQDASAGLVAAAMLSIVPGYISRSVAGSYDNEGIAIFCMLLTYTLWIKSVKTGSIFWGALCSLAYFYMVRALVFFVFIQFNNMLFKSHKVIQGLFTDMFYYDFSFQFHLDSGYCPC